MGDLKKGHEVSGPLKVFSRLLSVKKKTQLLTAGFFVRIMTVSSAEARSIGSLTSSQKKRQHEYPDNFYGYWDFQFYSHSGFVSL